MKLRCPDSALTPIVSKADSVCRASRTVFNQRTFGFNAHKTQSRYDRTNLTIRGGTMTDTKRNHWSAEELGEQSSYEGETEIKRRLARGDETVGKPDERDVAGSVPVEDTPEGRKDQERPNSVPEQTSQSEPVEKQKPAKRNERRGD
jgi:hypothetical protein